MSQIQNIPELRFPEFDGEWNKFVLKDLTKINQGLQIAISERYTEEVKNSYFYITNEFLKKNSSKNYYILNPPKSVICTEEDILMTRTGNTGMVVTGVSGAFHNNFFKIKFDKSKLDKDFLVYFLKLYNTQCTILRLAGTSTIPDLNHSDFYRIKILIPSSEEQQKIATFLTSVDKRIQALEQKKELLEQYKKGVMQKIFSREVRFQPGTVTHHLPLVAETTTIYNSNNTYPDWEVKKLGEIGEFQTSSVDKLTKEDEKKVFLVNYMNVYRHETINNETIKDFQIVSASDNQLISNNLKKGDILFTPSSETPTDIGHSVVMFEDIENAVYSYHLIRFRPNVNIDILYSHYFCNNPTILRQLSRYATGSTRFTISVKNFSNVTVELPCLEEQQKIAGFLGAIDTKIEAVTSQIKHSKTFKKGLLQKMFV